MKRLPRYAAIAFVVVGISSQFIRPARTNPRTDPSATMGARMSVPTDISAILARGCRDCHSNETRWPWYTNVSPVSWLVANHVHHAREHFNYSEWTSIDEDERDKLLGGVCSLSERGRMPLPSYLLMHRGANLSPAVVRTLCAWSEKMRDMLQ